MGLRWVGLACWANARIYDPPLNGESGCGGYRWSVLGINPGLPPGAVAKGLLWLG